MNRRDEEEQKEEADRRKFLMGFQAFAKHITGRSR